MGESKSLVTETESPENATEYGWKKLLSAIKYVLFRIIAWIFGIGCWLMVLSFFPMLWPLALLDIGWEIYKAIKKKRNNNSQK